MSAPQDSPAPSAGTRKLRLPRSRKAANPEARMPLVEHIRELRNRVIKAALAVVVGAIVGWVLYPHIWHFIQEPYCRLPQREINPSGALHHHGCTLYVTGIFDALFMRLKIAIGSGIILSAPLWMYQLWSFVAPGLHVRERRWAYLFAATAVPLFLVGGTISYFAMTKGLHFLVGMVPANVAPIFTVNTYLSYATAMLLIFGLSFELPLVMVMLNLAGVLTHERFRSWRRMIIFGVFVFAAIATPSPDPISMLLLAVPCVVLVELAEVFAWANDRRRARLSSLYPGLTPEEIVSYGLDQDPLAAVGSDDADPGR